LSQRQIVVPLIDAPIPDCRTSAARSLVLHRERGIPNVDGNSQASALIWTINSGGKSPGAARARTFLQPRQALLIESLAPQADDLSSRLETTRDLVVLYALGGKQDHSGALNLKIR
jgi:hypothetical protein